jgi:glycerol uptake facilitator-like aquaporin
MRLDGRRLTAEAIGTFFLVLVGPGAAMVNAWSHGAVGHVGVSLALAFVVIAMVFALGHLSGAHMNPAVTVAFWSVGRFAARDVLPYVIAQCTGAVCASLVLRAVLGAVGQMGATLPSVEVGGAFSIEWLLSFVLMFVVMAVATDDRVADGFAPLVVGSLLAFFSGRRTPHRRIDEPSPLVRSSAGRRPLGVPLALLVCTVDGNGGCCPSV